MGGRGSVAKQPEGTLSVVQIAQNNAVGCIRIYPAMLALAKNLQGLAVFGRLMAEGARAARRWSSSRSKRCPPSSSTATARRWAGTWAPAAGTDRAGHAAAEQRRHAHAGPQAALKCWTGGRGRGAQAPRRGGEAA